MATNEQRAKELEDKIKVLENLPGIKVLENLPGEGEADLVKAYKKELAELQGKEDKATVTTDSKFEIPMSPEEYDAAGNYRGQGCWQRE